ncbi:hypothetical protein BAUCODRAFT_539054 [Baudoinia panamericana UAMH 10762]|uniref:Uncharacterized protein n=1 Tax=Baudoinia panamericana (strain UAMH 10762) TaxID=717646 RepID=M2MUW9_BAUPA|nr:uncharacterized protein BAUCODRAFT_539054 [Baudoinia panamericana UAMH 10762]EMC95378.1 hypothetical protein BAUCODRAFT_539054 [Baudoinia panamericana UAMH 10762]
MYLPWVTDASGHVAYQRNFDHEEEMAMMWRIQVTSSDAGTCGVEHIRKQLPPRRRGVD